MKEFDKTSPYSHQYQMRMANYNEDIIKNGLSLNEINNLTISDFNFEYIPKTDKILCKEINNFIKRHEFLQKMSNYPTHLFVAKYKNILAGVVIMDMPNAFSKLLGEDTKKIERLISRGACISWSPKNLASALIMWSITWMVKNTNYRLFTAYSDPEAKELGTIYQACNFYYLGKNSGTAKQYKIDGSWKSDRYFRSRSVYKRLAKSNGIEWCNEWVERDRVLWDLIDTKTAMLIKQYSKDYQNSCESRSVPKKHKYAYILGANKGETKKLRKKFAELNPKMVKLSFPKERGKN